MLYACLCGVFNAPRVSQQVHLKQVVREAEPLEDWQREVEEEEVEPLEDWQREVEEEEVEPLEDWQREVEEEEVEPLEDWQQEVEGGDVEEEAGLTVHQVHDRRESSREEMEMRSQKKRERVSMALPFLTGISPAGFLSANRKQPGGTEHLVEVRMPHVATGSLFMTVCTFYKI